MRAETYQNLNITDMSERSRRYISSKMGVSKYG
jgi:hypothetical protein